MEKITFQNSERLKLVGTLNIPKKKTKSAIIISHGFTANRDRPRLIKLSEILSKEGFTALRFDFGGCGESGDREITVKYQVGDLNSAIKYLRNKNYLNIGLYGESLGALTSILAYGKEIKAMVLLAPVTKAKLSSIIQKEELKQEFNYKDFIIYKKDEREFKVPKEYLEERQSINQQQILSKIKCPILIIHGDKDTTIPLEHSKDAMKFLSKKSKLEVIKDGDHRLNERINETIPLTVNWFKKYLK